jgi:hypothetical protein
LLFLAEILVSDQCLITNKSEKENTPEHAELLATKWLLPQQLVDLAEKEGLMYYKGKFSAAEHQMVHEAIQAYQMVTGHLTT